MAKKWYQKQLRMVQTVLREVDIINYDADSVVEYLEKSNANCIIVNAGGIVDFFHSGLEGANLNPFMKDGQDILKDLIEAAHAKNIKVIARIDFRGADREFSRSHPDWFSYNEDGSPKMMSSVIKAEVDLHIPCYIGRYMNEQAIRFMRSLFEQYDVDGIWENAVSIPQGVCYCDRCKTKYRKDMGKELPTGKQIQDPAIREEYRQWKYKCAVEHVARMRRTVKEFGDEKAYAAEIWGFFKTSTPDAINVLDLEVGKENFDYFVTPGMVSQDGHPASYASGLAYPGSIVKHMKMISKDKQSVLLFGNNGGTLRYVKDPMVENKIWLWEAVSAGAGFWNCLFNGQHPAATHDNRAAYVSKPMYDFLQTNEELLEVSEPLADVAIYASKPTRDCFGAMDAKSDRCLCNMKGVERMLVEKHVQFVHFPGNVDVTLEELQQFKAIVLPNVACMSEHEVEVFREYVEQGGNLIATYETSLYDEAGNKRSDLALADVFGVTSTGITEDTTVDCYQLIRDYKNPLMKGIQDTEVLANGERTLLVNALPESKVATTYIPIIRNQPPEKAWIKNMETIYPVAVTNTYGNGKVAYFAFPVGRAVHNYAHDDFVQLFNNALDYVLNEDVLLETNAPASVHVQAIQTGEEKNGVMVSLVNHTGAMCRPVHELVPVYNLEVVVKLDKKPKGVKLLYAESQVEFDQSVLEDGSVALKIKVNRLDEFCSVWIEK